MSAAAWSRPLGGGSWRGASRTRGPTAGARKLSWFGRGTPALGELCHAPRAWGPLSVGLHPVSSFLFFYNGLDAQVVVRRFLLRWLFR